MQEERHVIMTYINAQRQRPLARLVRELGRASSAGGTQKKTQILLSTTLFWGATFVVDQSQRAQHHRAGPAAQALPRCRWVDQRPCRLAPGHPVISAAARTRGAPRRRRTHTAGWARARGPQSARLRSAALGVCCRHGSSRRGCRIAQEGVRTQASPTPRRRGTRSAQSPSLSGHTPVEEASAPIHPPLPRHHRLHAPCRSLLSLAFRLYSQRRSLLLFPHPHLFFPHRTLQPWRLWAPLSRPRRRCCAAAPPSGCRPGQWRGRRRP